MQRSLFTLTLLGGLLVFSPFAEAQRRGGQMEPMTLVGFEQVQKEIGLEGDKLDAVKGVIAELRESGRSFFSEFGNLREMSEDERNKAIAEMRSKRDEINKEAFAKISKHLNSDQIARLNQIALQQRGAQALDDEKIVIKLELTEDQQLKVSEIIKSQADEQRKLMEDVRSAGREGFAQMREKFGAMRKQTEEKLMAVLTDAQKTKLSELKGKAFELDRSALRGGGRRQRGDRREGGDRPQRPSVEE